MAERKLARWQRAQARRTTQSRGWWKAQHKINRLHRRITGLQKNAQHHMTAAVVHKFRNVVIEDLHVRGMMQGRTPKAQAGAGMGELKRQIIYKGQWNRCEVQLAHRFYPSSKTCSNCGEVNAKLKREPRWQCPSSGTTHDRNENAAVNLRELLTLPAGSGMTLRNGKALAAGMTNDETSPNDRRTATHGFSPRNADCGRVPRLVLPPVCRRVLVLGRQVERRRFTTIKKSVAAQPAGQTAKPKGTQRHDISNPGETAGVILPDDYAQRGHGFRNMQAGAQRIGGALEVTTNRPGKDMTATQLQEASKLTACTPTRVMLVDNHPITRAGLQEALEHSGEFEVVGQAGDGVAAVEAALNIRPDIIIMDLMMPLKNGIDTCREITDLLPDTRVLILTAHTELHAIVEAIAAGATGYLSKVRRKGPNSHRRPRRCRRPVHHPQRRNAPGVHRDSSDLGAG